MYYIKKFEAIFLFCANFSNDRSAFLFKNYLSMSLEIFLKTFLTITSAIGWLKYISNTFQQYKNYHRSIIKTDNTC